MIEIKPTDEVGITRTGHTFHKVRNSVWVEGKLSQCSYGFPITDNGPLSKLGRGRAPCGKCWPGVHWIDWEKNVLL